MSVSDDETLSWHDSTSAMDYSAIPPPVEEKQSLDSGNEGHQNLTKYAIGATVGAAAVLILPTIVLVGAGVAAGAAIAKGDKVSQFYNKHTGRSSATDSQAVKNAMTATVAGAKSVGRSMADKFRKLAGKSEHQPGASYGEKQRRY